MKCKTIEQTIDSIQQYITKINPTQQYITIIDNKNKWEQQNENRLLNKYAYAKPIYNKTNKLNLAYTM